MKKFRFKKAILCIVLFFMLGIGSVSAKMFGHNCGFTIEYDGSGSCTVHYTVTAWYFWIPDRDYFDTPCDWGNPVDVCNAFAPSQAD